MMLLPVGEARVLCVYLSKCNLKRSPDIVLGGVQALHTHEIKRGKHNIYTRSTGRAFSHTATLKLYRFGGEDQPYDNASAVNIPLNGDVVRIDRLQTPRTALIKRQTGGMRYCD